MPLISAADAPTFLLPGITFTGLASPSRGSTQTCVWTLALDPGVTGEPHHLDQEEVFVAVAGAAVATLGDDEIRVAAGDALIVPAGVDFALTNPYDERFVAVAVLPVGGRASLGDGEYFVPPWAA
jgi:mannose-6-phosphate isomerase-like protein (cupin superfamily)